LNFAILETIYRHSRRGSGIFYARAGEVTGYLGPNGRQIDDHESDKPPPQGGGSGNGLKALFRPEAGKMGPAPSGLQEVDGLNHLL
jgi:hypothetical protein